MRKEKTILKMNKSVVTRDKYLDALVDSVEKRLEKTNELLYAYSTFWNMENKAFEANEDRRISRGCGVKMDFSPLSEGSKEFLATNKPYKCDLAWDKREAWFVCQFYDGEYLGTYKIEKNNELNLCEGSNCHFVGNKVERDNIVRKWPITVADIECLDRGLNELYDAIARGESENIKKAKKVEKNARLWKRL